MLSTTMEGLLRLQGAPLLSVEVTEPDGGPGHISVPWGGVPPVAGGALFLAHSGIASTGVLLGIVFGSSTFTLFDCSHTNVPLALRFSEKEGVCDAQQSDREINRIRDRKVATRGLKRRSQVENTDKNTLSNLTVCHSHNPPPETEPLHKDHLADQNSESLIYSLSRPFPFFPQPPFFHSLPQKLSFSFPSLLWLYPRLVHGLVFSD